MKVLVLISLLVGAAYASMKCAKPLDVVLVVEDTMVLGASDEETLRNFLADIVNYLAIVPQSPNDQPRPFDQVAYVLYNTSTAPIFHLNTYTETNDARSAVLRQPFSRKDGPFGQIDQALDYTWKNELTVSRGERSCYPTVVILVSYSQIHDDNSFGVNEQKKAQDAKDLTAARTLINSGALIVTVGVGSDRDPDHLIKVASDPGHYYDYPDFSSLTTDEAVKIATDICGYIPTGNFYPCEMQTIKADFTFVVDTSSAFTVSYANDIVAFMQNFLTPYTYDHTDGVQAALVTYSKTAAVDIYFTGNSDDSAKDVADFITKANNTLYTAIGCKTCQTDSRCIDQALEQVNYHVLKPENGFRNTCAIHYVFVFTSGCFNCSDPIPLANTIRKDKNTEIFVVTLQPSQPAPPAFGFWKEPLEIADDYSHLWEAQLDPNNILPKYLHKQAWRNVCVSRGSVVCPTPPPPSPSTAAPPPSSS